MIEKAWAKLNGDYCSIDGGFARDCLHDLTVHIFISKFLYLISIIFLFFDRGLLLFIIELEKKLNGKNGNIFYGSNCLTEKNKISLCVLVPIQEKINSETILKEILNLEMVFSILMPIPS